MKKRITALILVVVMSVLALFGCGEYDYSDAKLDKFTSADTQALLNALKNIVIEDEDEFSTDSEKRQKELHDIILRSLLNADNANSEEYKEGVADYADALYLCYYAKYTDDDGVEHIFNIPKTSGKEDYVILPANKTYLQFGVNDNADSPLFAAIEAAFKDKDIKDSIYTLDTTKDGTLKVEAGDNVLLTFTYTDAEGVQKTISNIYVTIPAADPAETETADETELKSIADLKFFETFLWNLVGKTVGKELTGSNNKFEYELPAAPDAQDGEDEDEETTPAKVTYTKVTVVGVADGEATNVKVEFPDEDKKELTDLFGNKVDVKGKEVDYFVFPTYIKKVDYVNIGENATIEDYVKNATIILTVFYGSASIQELTDENGKATGDKVGALDIFSSEDYKITYKNDKGEDETKTFKEIMEEFVTLQKAYEDAKSTYDKAVSEYEDAEETLESVQKKYDDAVKTLADAEKKLEDYKAAKQTVSDAEAALEAYKTANPDAAEDDAELVALTAAVDSAKTAFEDLTGLEAEDYTSEKADEKIADAEEYVTQSKEDLYGDPDDEEDTGIEGELEDAKAEFESACEALYGHTNEDGDLYCDKCGAVDQEVCGSQGHADADNDCKCDTCYLAYNHIDEDNNCVCDREDCEAKLKDRHVDNSDPKDCKCDNCDAAMAHVDADDDGKCDNCEAEFTATEEEKSAEVAYNEALAERDAFVLEKVLKVTKEKGEDETEEPLNIAEAIVREFDESVYEVLEETYFTAINTKIMKEVYSAIDKYITVDRDKLPRKAVNEIYKKIYEGHKYDFFTSAGYADSNYNYYDQYEGDFEAYLMIKTGTETFKAAKAALKEEAKDYVEEIVKIYKAAQILNVVYTDEEFEVDYEEEYNETTALIWEYYYGVEYMTEQDLHIARQADKLFGHLFATNKTDDKVDVDETTLLFSYKNISYTIKAEAED